MERMSVSEREELWDRWEAGEWQRSISRRLGRSPSTVRTLLVGSGWKGPNAGGEWCSLRLSSAEREEALERYRWWRVVSVDRVEVGEVPFDGVS